MRHRLTIAAVLACCALLASAGCKEVDTAGGLLIVPYVNAVKIDGRQYIRLVGKRSVALIDPRGAFITEFYLQNRPRFELFEDEAKKIESPALPNAIPENAPEFRPGFVGESGDKPPTRYWQSEAWTVGIIMLSDRDGALGPFYRKTFELLDDGTLTIRVERVGAAAPANLVKPEGVTQRSDGRGQTLTRRVTPSPDGWTETWSIQTSDR